MFIKAPLDWLYSMFNGKSQDKTWSFLIKRPTTTMTVALTK